MPHLYPSNSNSHIKRKIKVSYVLLEVRGVESKSHEASTDKTGDGDGHDPREDEQENSLPVNSLEAAVAKTDTDGGTGDTHGGRDRELVLGEDKNGDSGTHLHGGTTRRRVVGDLVTHNCEELVMFQ
jgi:hypothetical protein